MQAVDLPGDAVDPAGKAYNQSEIEKKIRNTGVAAQYSGDQERVGYSISGL